MLLLVKLIGLAILNLSHLSAFANDETNQSNLPAISQKDMQWATELSEQFKSVSKKAIIDKFLSLKNMQGRTTELELYTNNKSRLLVFVSGSMPKPLLKAYNMEAAKLGASLVLKGLPNGSFKDLAKLVTEISESPAKNFGHIQIDDVAFEKFNIKSVPAIVLLKNYGENFLSSSKDEKEEFDKVTGAVTIKAALEKFADQGDLRAEAEGYLGK